jgi:hypothetical protein
MRILRLPQTIPAFCLFTLAAVSTVACGSAADSPGSAVAEEGVSTTAAAQLICPIGTTLKCTGAHCVCVAAPYEVQINVTGLTSSGLTLLNDGNVIGVPQNGTYYFSMPVGQLYDVFVRTQPGSQACTVTNAAGYSAGAPVQVSCGAAYTIGGTITGLEANTTPSNGLSLQLSGGSLVTSSLTPQNNGAFTFPATVGNGSAYSVAIDSQPPGQTCTLANGSGTVSGANVTNVDITCTGPAAPTWTALPQPPPFVAYGMWMMQDGTVLAEGNDAQTLYRLTPSQTGSYIQGIWSRAGQFLLEKADFASGLLPNGNLVTCGGEHTGAGLPMTESNFCEMYNPTTQTSQQITAPPGWASIGDSPSTTLADGSWFLGNTQGQGNQAAIMNPSTLAWTFVGGDTDNEQGYALLQTGDVLTPNVYGQISMRYSPGSAGFVSDANVPVMLGGTYAGSPEIGPWMTLQNGQLIWFGTTGHTAIYTPTTAGQNGSWQAGPNFPVVNGDQLFTPDAPALLEPTGRVLVVANGTVSPQQFVEYTPWTNTLSQVSGAPVGSGATMLLLPSGEALVSLSNGSWYDVQFSGTVMTAPTITSFPSSVAPGTTVTLSGTQLCGLSEVSTYGDDSQQAENYPLVRITSGSTVKYLRAHDVSTRSIAPNLPGSVEVDVPLGLAAGTYSVQVVAMGIPSAPVSVQVQ